MELQGMSEGFCAKKTAGQPTAPCFLETGDLLQVVNAWQKATDDPQCRKYSTQNRDSMSHATQTAALECSTNLDFAD